MLTTTSSPTPDTLNGLLAERGTQHGSFLENAIIARHLKDFVRSREGYNVLSHVQAEALDMILHKISRLLSGNPDHDDHWRDIAGYATLAHTTTPPHRHQHLTT